MALEKKLFFNLDVLINLIHCLEVRKVKNDCVGGLESIIMFPISL